MWCRARTEKKEQQETDERSTEPPCVRKRKRNEKGKKCSAIDQSIHPQPSILCVAVKTDGIEKEMKKKTRRNTLSRGVPDIPASPHPSQCH